MNKSRSLEVASMLKKKDNLYRSISNISSTNSKFERIVRKSHSFCFGETRSTAVQIVYDNSAFIPGSKDSLDARVSEIVGSLKKQQNNFVEKVVEYSDSSFGTATTAASMAPFTDSYDVCGEDDPFQCVLEKGKIDVEKNLEANNSMNAGDLDLSSKSFITESTAATNNPLMENIHVYNDQEGGSDIENKEHIEEEAPEEQQDCTNLTKSFPHRSCLKKQQGNLYIRPKGPWRRLSMPDMDVVSKTQSGQSFVEPEPIKRRRRRHVSFATVQVRRYFQTLGDNPAVAYGPPIQLDWKYDENAAVEINAYEGSRKIPRRPPQMVLSTYQRRNILKFCYGYSDEEMKRAQREARRIARQRQTTTMLMPAMMVEELLMSAGRKTKRFILRKERQ